MRLLDQRPHPMPDHRGHLAIAGNPSPSHIHGQVRGDPADVIEVIPNRPPDKFRRIPVQGIEDRKRGLRPGEEPRHPLGRS
jgi:hypothetical protein